MTKQPQKPNFHKLYVTLYNCPEWLEMTALHRWLYVVLLTGSQSNSIGCYVCRISVLAEDAGFDVTLNDLETVCKQMGIRFDNRSRTVYIPNRLKWDPPANPNVLDGMVKTAANLPKCENQETVMQTVTQMVSQLVIMTDRGRKFVDNWQEKLVEIINGLGNGYSNGLGNASETPYPYPKPQPYPQPYPKPNTIAPRSDDHDAVPSDLFLTYPCNGSPNVYYLTMAQVNEWSMLYQGVDVAAECKKALAWIQANNKKTAKGMPKFLVSWLGRANDRGGSKNQAQRKPRTIQDTLDIADQIVNRLNEYEVANG